MQLMELVVAGLLLAVGLLVVYDSHRLGSKWGSDGPQSGYFPFYIGLLLCLSSGVTLVQVALAEKKRRADAGEPPDLFVGWSELKLVMSVLVPALIYVVGVQFIGIYVASTVYIALFMRWLGKYSWLKSVVIAFVVSATIFILFEIWFKVPLFKGAYDPLSFLGY